MKTALFRTLCDRLASLRLLNMRRAKRNRCDFIKDVLSLQVFGYETLVVRTFGRLS